MRYFIKLSYRGTQFHGWQIQPNAVSIQGELEKALSTILGEVINVVGCGRTDTGVHAHEYFAHFDCTGLIESSRLRYKLNSFLHKDIAIQDIFKVTPDAHARFDATSRTYRYYIHYNKDPFIVDSWYLYNLDLDLGKMNRFAKKLLSIDDFSAFEKKGSDNKTSTCKVQYAEWFQEGHQIYFEIRADRFLRNMVRAIVGTLVDVGKGKINETEFDEIIESKNRENAGASVPANGLFLWEITYPLNIREL